MAIGIAPLLALGATGCQSTQDKAAALSQEGSQAFKREGLHVSRPNPSVRIISTTAVQDPNGTAVAVRLKNMSGKRMVKVPIAINVRDKAGKKLFANDAPGLDDSLVGIAFLRPKEEVTWVNDQVVAPATPGNVTAVAGVEAKKLAADEPRITLQQIKQREDSAGINVTGFVMNKSGVEQRNLVIYAVATRSGKVVAAGRGLVARVKPGKRARFTTYFIGDPTGAKLDLAVPATTLG
ncbi:MAG: hypothetical protein JHC95_18340 [Solirubrobacteraceae bacterium]|nr:hypothetical protein [Solirubrobacteraceae bacterium]